jgi:hypothetical protein
MAKALLLSTIWWIPAGPLWRIVDNNKAFAIAFRTFQHFQLALVIMVVAGDAYGTAVAIREMYPKAHFVTIFAKPAGRPLVDDYVVDIPPAGIHQIVDNNKAFAIAFRTFQHFQLALVIMVVAIPKRTLSPFSPNRQAVRWLMITWLIFRRIPGLNSLLKDKKNHARQAGRGK